MSELRVRTTTWAFAVLDLLLHSLTSEDSWRHKGLLAASLGAGRGVKGPQHRAQKVADAEPRVHAQTQRAFRQDRGVDRQLERSSWVSWLCLRDVGAASQVTPRERSSSCCLDLEH